MHEYIIISDVEDAQYYNFTCEEQVNRGDIIEAQKIGETIKLPVRVSDKKIQSCDGVAYFNGNVTLYVEDI